MAVAVAACGSGVSIDDFQSKLADAFCKNAVECQQAPDLTSCKAAIQVKSRLFETLVAKVKSKVIAYDADKAGECIDSITTASCAFTGFRGEASNPCQETFAGTVAANGACTIDFECASQGICVQTDPNCDSDLMCCPGTCRAATPTVPLGGDCTNANCDYTGYCSSATNKCTAPLTTAGASCDEFDACANPMYCDLFATTPTCVTAAARGATCDPMSLIPCADSRDYCDATTMKCTANVAVGQACGGTNEASCVGYADCTNMICVALALAGGACTAGDDSSCLGDLDCPSGTCTLTPPQTACARTEADPAPRKPVPTARRVTPKLDWMPRWE